MKDKLLSNVKAVKLVDRPFDVFKKRFHTVMGDKLNMTDNQLRTIYDGVSPLIETSIYAEMEDVLVAIRNAYRAVDGWMKEDMASSRKHQDESSKYDAIQAI